MKMNSYMYHQREIHVIIIFGVLIWFKLAVGSAFLKVVQLSFPLSYVYYHNLKNGGEKTG